MATTLEESARRAGHHRWAEQRLFEVTGAWVAATPEPAAKLLLDRHSQHHAWRAAQWWDRLPVLADVDRDAMTVPPAGPLGSVLAGLEPAPGPADGAAAAGTAARLGALYRVVLPRLWRAYRDHLGVAGPVADGATRRTLAIVMADVEGDWHEGEAVLQDVIGTVPGASGAAAAAVAALEGRFTTATA